MINKSSGFFNLDFYNITTEFCIDMLHIYMFINAHAHKQPMYADSPPNTKKTLVDMTNSFSGGIKDSKEGF